MLGGAAAEMSSSSSWQMEKLAPLKSCDGIDVKAVQPRVAQGGGAPQALTRVGLPVAKQVVSETCTYTYVTELPAW